MSEKSPLVERINQLAGIAKQRALTPEETREREALRQEYLSNFRRNFRQQLDNTYVQKQDGAVVPLKDWHSEVQADADEFRRPE